MPTLRRQPTLVGFDSPPEPVETTAKPLVAAVATGTPAERTSGGLSGKTVYLVDSYSLIYQVFHALPEMTGPTGQPVGAVQGFVRDLLDLVEVRNADYLICAF